MQRIELKSFFYLRLYLKIICLLPLFIPIHSAFGQNENIVQLPLKSTGNLLFYSDIYQFEASPPHTQIEISYAVPLLQFVDTETGVDSVHLILQLSILDSIGNELASVKDQKAISPARLTDENALHFIDLKSFLIQLKQIRFSIRIEDKISGRSGEISNTFITRHFTDQFSISDPFFASHVQKAESESNFVKHGILLVPSPSREFWLDNNEQKFYLYYEINNMYYNEEDPSYYKINYNIADIAGNIVKEENKNAILKTSENTSRIEIIPLNNLPGGIYKLTVSVSDLKYETTRSIQRYFKIFSSENLETLFLPMEKDDIDKYYNQIKYIATDREKKIFRSLDEKGKQEFILNFWRRRDPSPNTPTNEFMVDHFKKFAFIEKNIPEGIDSDRARILIRYGHPLEIERFPSAEGIAKPVEIWTYGINGNTKFFFVDRTRDGVYVLMHSNHPDEYNNPDWRDEIK